ncbi:MAG: adenosylcobinamide-GDP ribazoletransferase [Sedimenticola sp.]|nr:adenosylcobinamide-GDP ribazoletransferase [Sedimenticola sp.]
MLRPFFHALGFLTRLPIPRNEDRPSDQEQGQSMLYYPLVGLLIGLILTAVSFLLGDADSLLAAAIILSVWVAITGALHIDGLADLADAWIGGLGDRERTLAIMKDPTCGPMAVATVVLLLVVKLAALATILTQGDWTILLLVPMLGRGALVASFIAMPYIRTGGLGAVMADNLPELQAKGVLLILPFICFLCWGWSAIWVLLGCGLVFWTMRRALLKRINGLTGDVAGAFCELIEASALVIAALVII